MFSMKKHTNITMQVLLSTILLVTIIAYACGAAIKDEQPNNSKSKSFSFVINEDGSINRTDNNNTLGGSWNWSTGNGSTGGNGSWHGGGGGGWSNDGNWHGGGGGDWGANGGGGFGGGGFGGGGFGGGGFGNNRGEEGNGLGNALGGIADWFRPPRLRGFGDFRIGPLRASAFLGNQNDDSDSSEE
ncbi:heterogeneous nuclear ribonucleoprotein A3 homolog 1-like [Leptopilina boulardi]|uniref:heterogeneous nuclear ribonucleoprotein A3 homolog 1-like n=1 Tax=Leptopilina boulardi TaxID=63433 RepID=UPI0021F5DACC|nr:heterogeneous nuclear ribonucleoprotein A3 homolog 1-like [Leptopilina boulardi]